MANLFHKAHYTYITIKPGGVDSALNKTESSPLYAQSSWSANRC